MGIVTLRRKEMQRIAREAEAKKSDAKVIDTEVIEVDDAKVLELAESGMETKDIAKETGLSSQKVAAIIRKGK